MSKPAQVDGRSEVFAVTNKDSATFMVYGVDEPIFLVDGAKFPPVGEEILYAATRDAVGDLVCEAWSLAEDTL